MIQAVLKTDVGLRNEHSILLEVAEFGSSRWVLFERLVMTDATI
jgi:hypothetical protein